MTAAEHTWYGTEMSRCYESTEKTTEEGCPNCPENEQEFVRPIGGERARGAEGRAYIKV